MSFFYDRTLGIARGGVSVYSSVSASVQQRRSAEDPGYRNGSHKLERWRVLIDPAFTGSINVGDSVTDDLGRALRVLAVNVTPLGIEFNATTDEVAAGSALASHPLYLVEASSAITQDPTTGLPVVAGQTVTQILPQPRVMLGGKTMPGPGGAQVLLGDITVTNLSRASWPFTRLMNALGFRIDSATGELYEMVTGTLEEDSPITYSVALQRVSQPRP